MITTISRQAATNGGLLAQLVANQLHLRLYDNKVIDLIARKMDNGLEHVTPFGEIRPPPVEAPLRDWRHSINRLVYLRQLRTVLEMIVSQGDAVMVGRGANFLLIGTATLRVRVMASLKQRIAMYRMGEEVSAEEARAWIRSEDQWRAASTRELFRHNIDNPLQYDQASTWKI
ncbi:MAG: cytidylate kinase-like family protein [Armatimonadota bacterium]